MFESSLGFAQCFLDRSKRQLLPELRKAVAEATALCAKHGVELAGIKVLVAGSLERLQKIEDAMNALISPDPSAGFFGAERLVNTLYRAVRPDPATLEFGGHTRGGPPEAGYRDVVGM